jgi:hypothetical protein
VTAADEQRIGVLVVRAWLEDASDTVLRARITQTLDITAHDDVVIVVSTSDDVCDAVRAWLDAFVGG